jgi:hypothetical protein
LLTDPSFSKDAATGRRSTSVFIVVGSTPGLFQKIDVSVSHKSEHISHERFFIASLSQLELAPPTAGL